MRIFALLSILLISCQSNTNPTFSSLINNSIVTNSQPELFLPGLVNTGFNERDAALASNNQDFFYTIWGNKWGTIVSIQEIDGRLIGPTVMSFSGQYSDLEPALSPDGNRLYFASNRPLQGGTDSKDYDIWVVNKSGDTWGEPKNLGPTINTPGDEFYPSASDDGTLYFTAQLDSGMGREDIWKSVQKEGIFQKPENLGPNINTPFFEYNAFVSPDKSYLIFGSFGREDDLGGGDLYISFNSETGWTNARHLGSNINSPALDYCPFVSMDGQYFFFTSQRSVDMGTKPKDFAELSQILAGPGNGFGDIYWMKADSILMK